MTTTPTPTPVPVAPTPRRELDVLGAMLIISAAITGVGTLYKATGSLAVTAIAAILAGVLGTAAQARRVYVYRARHWD